MTEVQNLSIRKHLNVTKTCAFLKIDERGKRVAITL